MLDTIQILFWSLTYVLIIIYSIKNYSKKQVAIPYLTVLLNFSWEINALIYSVGFWGHICWLFLDVFILIINASTLRNWRRKLFYVFLVLPFAIVFRCIFLFPYGMLLSCFVIDLIMEIDFWVSRKRLLSNGKVVIAITKLIGDLAAAIYYVNIHILTGMIGIFVLIFNIAYLVYAIKEARQKQMTFAIKM